MFLVLVSSEKNQKNTLIFWLLSEIWNIQI